ncbi:HECT-like ubiquitin-conjugating enzyme-binding-domain-containing protein [Hygrophoropsis aurantiaca]|uniref:HECT-like ubiquitin-conjugating enzyme-binding-domain-containing protein n=1 Tax=Hygrophoropsis aurantiaca TaxID=72124 RepID=A0ACB8A4T0_9AGAM|nr:HECT-like ubiquitin-conjugating enzyme-binding-domain-containing protein [Hygrophoropsis aurantiaca]
MEKARREGDTLPSAMKGKQKEQDMRDLDHMFDLIGRASDRKLTDQSVVMDGARRVRIEKARQSYQDQRDSFVVQLMEKSGAGRYHSQDATPKTRDLDDLVTLPEFIREPIPIGVRIAPPRLAASSSTSAADPPNSDRYLPGLSSRHHKSRSRSSSAPSLSWLRSTSGIGRRISKSSSRPGSSHGQLVPGQVALDVSYIAEYRETLKHVVVFLSLSGQPSSAELEAEILPSSSSGLEGDWLVLRSGSVSSPPLSMPVQTIPGKQDVQVRHGYYELRIAAAASATSWDDDQTQEPTPLISASQLGRLAPTSFICASCSLPLVHLRASCKYKDLPSEHWEELVDAWMCHADQTLHQEVAKHGRGFWPAEGEALVGGSYVLFGESSVVNGNVSTTDLSQREQDWRLVRCLCGAMVGRRHERQGPGGAKPAMYRFLKYAIRPLSSLAEPPKVPVSAFVVQDMLEHVSAHATYRFVISDEEEELPRLLIWLFKPRIRLSYMLATPYVLPKKGSIEASKVMYQILGPSSPTDLKDLLNKYPGFPQAEHLFYPRDVCRKLANLLAESTESYPEGLKTMTGLDVGWLQRI